MIDTDKYEETDHPELVEFEGETLGDTLTNLITEVMRLRKLEAAVVGSWMRACDDRGPWHKALRYPCTELGYLELRDVEHARKGFDGNSFTYTSKEFHLKEEYEEMAKQWIKEKYGVEEE
tara:strand:- start:482 stop:841 length:360 start_codon:yes stop_codon:yes gene_type:complete